MSKEIFKIMDANLNRTREGLRVCEDIARFALMDKSLSRSLKTVRHSATKTLLRSKNLSLRKLVGLRDTETDVLKFIDAKIKKKTSIADIFMSNIQRAKESLRVLEECGKVTEKTISHKYRKLRFDVYDIEKKAAGLLLKHI
ncbi:MAG: hypothetical protein KKH08_02200 [Candidatus Omnitrophica bacterium]|nr:hypothetical protein [Candidatus Omnitrophota bacterium]